MSATQSAILFDLSEADFLAGVDSTIFISQVSFSGEGGAAFTGCESPLAQVDVHPNPAFQTFDNGASLIDISEACEVGITAAIQVNNLNNRTEADYTVSWNVADNAREGFDGFTFEVDEQFNVGSPTAFSISVVTDATQCSAVINESKIVGESPIADFVINNFTENNNTAITVRDQNTSITNTLVESISMTVVDRNSGNPIFQETRPGGDGSNLLLSSFVNNYAAGSYTATMVTTTFDGCSDDETLNFNILPQVTVSVDTTITFDNGNLESWFAEEDRDNSGEVDADNVRQLVGNSWQLTTASGTEITGDDANGGEAIMWVTNPSGSYNPTEVSYVYSPSFNITIPRPAISFDYYLDMVNNGDGVVLQVSIDDGNNWETLGNRVTGLEWYNLEGVAANPGGLNNNPGQLGWAGDKGNSWFNGTHAITGNDLSTVRFRFALGSRSGDKVLDGDIAEGFAFDNFRIFSRDRVTLLETFTSSLTLDANGSNPSIVISDTVTNRFPGDVVLVNYFTDLADGDESSERDEIFAQNPSDPNSRLAYYGVNEITTAVLGGSVGSDILPEQDGSNPDGNLGNLGFTVGNFLQDLLVATDVNISLETSIADNVVNMEVSVQASYPDGDSPFSNESQISTRVMILQETVSSNALENVNPESGEVVFRNVLREIVSGSSGIITSGEIDNNIIFVNDALDWEVSGIFAEDGQTEVTMTVVVFVQDEITKEVLQVLEQDIVVPVPETVTSIHPEFFSRNESYEIYPNPAENVFTVALEKPTMMNLQWTLIDQSGRRVITGDISQGSQAVEVITDQLSSGLYFFQLYNADHVWESQRVMIVRGNR